jgi:cytochrome P450
MLSDLIAAEEAGDRLSEVELLATCILLLVAGHETTVNLVGNGTLALLRHPDRLGRLRRDPALIGTAVEELLRFDGQVQRTARIPGEDVAFGGRTIPAGAMVMPFIGAADRDPAQFPDPDRLDLGRTDNRHIAFGWACTSAWAHRWPASRARSPSTRCCAGCRGSRSPRTGPSSARASPCADWPRSPSASEGMV